MLGFRGSNEPILNQVDHTLHLHSDTQTDLLGPNCRTTDECCYETESELLTMELYGVCFYKQDSVEDIQFFYKNQ